MKLTTIQRSLLLILLYIGIFFALVFLQFSKSAIFSKRLGVFFISGNVSGKGEEKGKKLDRILVDTGGFEFSFSEHDPLIWMDSSGSLRKAFPIEWTERPAGFQILFDSGLSLDFSSSAESAENFRLKPIAERTAPKSIRIRYSLAKKSEIVQSGDGGREMILDSVRYSLRLPSSVALKTDVKTLIFSYADSGYSPFSVAKSVSSQAASLGTIQDRANEDPKAFRAEIVSWIDKAYGGWKSSRFLPAEGLWRFGEGDNRFLEKTLTAYYAEALSRGEYAEARAKTESAVASWPDRLGWQSNVYLGSISSTSEAAFAADAAEGRRIALLVQAKDSSLFEKEGLVTFILDRVSSTLAQEVLAYADSFDSSGITEKTAIGLLGCIVEASEFLQDAKNPFLRHETLVEKKIVQATRKAGDRLYYLDGETCDTYDSILCGQYLIKRGNQTNKDLLVGIGQSLVNGSLKLADAEGFIPKTVTIKGDSIVSKNGLYSPETIYPLIAENPYFPREVSFYKEAGPGVWAWTCAKDVQVKMDSSGLVFSAAFPQGATNFLTIHGIKPFSKIQLYDMDFRTDPQFERYDSSGWAYHESNRTLFVKMKHKSEEEKVRIFF